MGLHQSSPIARSGWSAIKWFASVAAFAPCLKAFEQMVFPVAKCWPGNRNLLFTCADAVTEEWVVTPASAASAVFSTSLHCGRKFMLDNCTFGLQ